MKADLHKVLELEMRINALEKTVSGLLEQTQKLAGVLNDVWACVKQIDNDLAPLRQLSESFKQQTERINQIEGGVMPFRRIGPGLLPRDLEGK